MDKTTMPELYGSISLTELSTSDAIPQTWNVINDNLGEGQAGKVILVEGRDDRMLALKIPLIRRNPEALRPEGVLLRNIETQWQAHHTDQPLPIPRNAQLVSLRDEGRDIVGLLMENVGELPKLSEAYRRLAATTPADRLRQSEAMAWDAGRQYLNLLRLLTESLKVQVADRKVNTFYWDTNNQRLIVIDWGESKVATSTDVTNILGLFGDIWYTMMTGLTASAEMVPPLLADQAWGEISIRGRLLLLALTGYRPSGSTVDLRSPFEIYNELIQETLDLIRRPEQLFMRFEMVRQQWPEMSKGDALNRVPEAWYNLEDPLTAAWCIADLTRRLADKSEVRQAANDICEKVRASFETVIGDGLGRNDDLTARILLNQINTELQKKQTDRALRILEALQDGRRVQEKFYDREHEFSRDLYDVVNLLATQSSDLAGQGLIDLFRMQQAFDAFHNRLSGYSQFDPDDLDQLKKLIVLRLAVGQAWLALGRGDNAAAKVALSAYSDHELLLNTFQDLGVDNRIVERINDTIGNNLQKAPAQTAQLKILQTHRSTLICAFEEAANKRDIEPLLDYHQKLTHLLDVPILPITLLQREVLSDYAEMALQLILAIDPSLRDLGYTFNDGTSQAGSIDVQHFLADYRQVGMLYKIQSIVNQLPELYSYLLQTPLFVQVHDYYSRLYRYYQETDNVAIEPMLLRCGHLLISLHESARRIEA